MDRGGDREDAHRPAFERKRLGPAAQERQVRDAERSPLRLTMHVVARFDPDHGRDGQAASKLARKNSGAGADIGDNVAGLGRQMGNAFRRIARAGAVVPGCQSIVRTGLCIKRLRSHARHSKSFCTSDAIRGMAAAAVALPVTTASRWPLMVSMILSEFWPGKAYQPVSIGTCAM